MKAIVILVIAAVWLSPLAAQDTTGLITPNTAAHRTERLYRDPHRALILGSLIPGAGHIYAGEYLRGVVTYVGTVSGIGSGMLRYLIDRCTFDFLNASTCDPGPEWPHKAAGVAIVGISLWAWVSSARDAAHAAERANARHGDRKAKAEPLIETPVTPNQGWRVGVAVHW